MARTNLELTARQTATLLKCQSARETRRRYEAVGADHACMAAERDAALLAEEARLYEASASRRLMTAHEALRGQVIGVTAIDGLVELERALARGADEHAFARQAAADDAVRARAAAAAARAALEREMRVTMRRAKLAERAAGQWRRSVEAANEIERDDAVADTWRSR